MGKNSILIVDDDLILLKTAEEILSSIYTVSVAKSGKQAITLLKKGVVPDLILLDIAMPEMDGYTTLEKMKSIPNCQDIPVIFLTGFAESDYEVKGLKAGAVDCGTDELFLWICEKCDCPYLFQVRNRTAQRASKAAHRII